MNEHIQKLIQDLKNKDVEVRKFATAHIAIYDKEAKEAVPGLIVALRDSNWDVRNSAASSIGHIGPEAKEAVPYLIELLNADRDIRITAVLSLGHI